MGPKIKQDPKIEEEEEEILEEEAEEEEQEETQAEEQEDEEEDLSIEELKARLKKKASDLRAANKEAKDRRLRLEALEKEKKQREDAELSEKEKLERETSEQKTELEKLRSENRDLKLSQEFASAAASLKLSFASEKARETALRLLDPEEVGEDFSGMEDELKRLSKDHSYLFGKPDPNQFIDDGRKKTKVNGRTVTRTVIEKKRARIGGL